MSSSALAVQAPAQSSLDIYFDEAKFNQAMRVAETLSKSSLVPEHFRGEDNVANCLIALQFCARIKEDPFMVMQRLYVVHGRLGMESQLAIGMINRSGKFHGDIAWEPNGKKGDEFGYFAVGIKASNGVECREECTIAMAKAKGWWGKSGSNWPSMTDLMLKYRSAMILARLHCPDILLGMYTVEELKDIGEAEVITSGRSAAELDAALSGDDEPEVKEGKLVGSAPKTRKKSAEKAAAVEVAQEPAKEPETAPAEPSTVSMDEIKAWLNTLSEDDKNKFIALGKQYKETMGKEDAARMAYMDMTEAAQ